MKFSYKGMTRDRQKVSGSIEAKDEVEARLRLRSMQIRPDSVSEGGGLDFMMGFKFSGNINLGPVINLKGLLIFTRQFSSLIDSGVSIVQCLDILYQQERRRAFKNILGQVKGDIEAGRGLAESLAKHPSAFDELFVRVVEAGEISGTLDKALKNVGIQLEKLGRLRTKVIKALLYPMITVVAAIAALIFMLTYVIPEVAKLYGGAKLPDITIFVLSISKCFQDNAALILFGLALIPTGIFVAMRIRAIRLVVDPIWLKIPVFGALTMRSAVARFSRTMSVLIASGVPLLQAFEICEQLMTNLALRGAIHKASKAVAEGKSISEGLSYDHYFPPMVLHMINIGEMTGRLDELLGKVAEIYDDEVDNAVDMMTQLIQPVLIVAVGGLILFLMLSMYAPIFNLGEKMSGV